MKTITTQKPVEEVLKYLEKCQTVYLTGCGTCATMCRTGGKSEVAQMKAKLEAAGKKVTGWMVIPTSCDELTGAALEADSGHIEDADCILAMTCAIGVQTVAMHTKKPVYPALNTLFIGVEDKPGHFIEVCQECGSCVLGRTAAICPIVRCAKSLFNGPCGGSVKGKCEISPEVPCAWQLIYDRLAEMGRLDLMDELEPIHDWSKSVHGGPRRAEVDSECGIVQPQPKAAAAAK